MLLIAIAVNAFPAVQLGIMAPTQPTFHRGGVALASEAWKLSEECRLVGTFAFLKPGQLWKPKWKVQP